MIDSIGFPPLTMAVFIGLVLTMLMFDIISHRGNKEISLSSAVKWSAFYVAGSMAFYGFLYWEHGASSASLFLTGYTLEKVLAFDNLFVFSMIFAYFNVSNSDQHKALHWGIAGAIIFRLLFVWLGVHFLDKFGSTVEIIFAILILYSVYVMWKALDEDEEMTNYDDAWYVKAVRKLFPSAGIFFVVVCVIEISDILFAFDSVPAIIAITRDPLLIYSSMIFAILGLRSMYFIIAGLSKYLAYMDQAVMIVLVFIAGKLLVGGLFDAHLDPNISLGIIISILVAGSALSVMYPPKEE